MENPKFTQITTGQWRDAESKFNHTLYALGSDGKVYRFLVNEGWTALKGRNESPTRATSRSVKSVGFDDEPF